MATSPPSETNTVTGKHWRSCRLQPKVPPSNELQYCRQLAKAPPVASVGGGCAQLDPVRQSLAFTQGSPSLPVPATSHSAAFSVVS